MRLRFLLGLLAVGYSRAVIAGIQLLLVPALAVGWGLPLYGQWLMLASVPVFLAASDFGFSTVAGMRIIGEVAQGRTAEARVTYRSGRRMVAWLSAGVLVIALGVIVWLPADWLAVRGGMAAGPAREVLALLAVYGVLTLQGPLSAASARAMGCTAQSVAIDGTTYLAEGLAAITIVLGGGTPRAVALGWIAVRVVGVGTMVLYARRVAPWLHGPARVSAARVREMWRPALAAMALPLSQAGYLQGSALAVGAAGGAALVPVYTSLRTLSRLGLQVALIVAVPLMPEYAAARARGDDPRAARIAGALALSVIVLATGYGLVIAGLGQPLLNLWTRGAILPPPAMIVLTGCSATLAIIWWPLSDLLLAINRHEAFAYVFAGCALAAVGLTLLLVQRMGITGAALANLALEATMLVTVLLALRRNGCRLELRPRALLAVLAGREPRQG